MTSHLLLPTAVAALALIAGCNSMPPNNARLDDARRDYRMAQEDPTTRDRAATELRAAGDALQRADESWSRKDSVSEVDHWSYLARQRVAIARETGLRRSGEQASKDAQVGRDEVRLVARTEQADAAKRSAQAAQQEAQSAQQEAQSAQRDAQAAQQDAQAAQRQSATAQQAAETARLQAEAAQRQTTDARARNDELEVQLAEMNARKTERGMVVTIGDVLFETDAALLRADGLRNVDKLADFMKRYPQRSAVIEGFTDSTGSQDHNQALSGRRAEAVRNAIVERGVDRARLQARGYGEAQPVAGNESSSGRQMNRRVEIILSDVAGTVPPR
jgi:outer membrane protein OmpA-like peptidoglycan-associated protein